MFEENRSDFAAPVAGHLFVGLVATIACFFFFNIQCELTDFADVGLSQILGIVGLVIAGFNLYKANLLEGFMFGAVAVYSFTLDAMHLPVTLLAIAVLLVICAIVSYISGYIDLPIVCGCFAIAILFVAFDSQFKISIIPSLFFLGAAVVSFYLAICNWIFYQDLIEAYDDCCCDDDDCCCCDDDEDYDDDEDDDDEDDEEDDESESVEEPVAEAGEAKD